MRIPILIYEILKGGDRSGVLLRIGYDPALTRQVTVRTPNQPRLLARAYRRVANGTLAA